jgi:hypothetical protein
MQTQWSNVTNCKMRDAGGYNSTMTPTRDDDFWTTYIAATPGEDRHFGLGVWLAIILLLFCSGSAIVRLIGMFF